MESSSELASRVAAFARAVRARRKALRLTQIALSRLAGTGPDFVYDVENGKTTLRLDKLLALLDVLGLELVLDEGKGRLRIASALVPVASATRHDQTMRDRATGQRSSEPRRPSRRAKPRKTK
jgi:y4mF family transcriptional regulator